MKKLFILYSLIFFIASLSFSKTEPKKETNIQTARDKEIEKIEAVLKLDEKALERRYDFNMQVIKEGVYQIQKGNQNFLRDINYDNLRLFARGLMILGEDRLPPIGVLTKDTYEETVVNSFLGGLKNKDPRIRLFSIQVLKLFDPTYKMLKEIIKHTKIETDEKSNYHYFDIDLNVHMGNLKVEMLILKKFLRRIDLKKIFFDEKKTHPVTFLKISRKTFEILADRIANEPERDIPLNSFLYEEKINYFIAGLLNTDVYIKQRCAECIYIIYHKKETSYKTQNKIDKLRENVFSFENEAKKDQQRFDFIFRNKNYSTLLNDGSFILRMVFEEKDREKRIKSRGKLK